MIKYLLLLILISTNTFASDKLEDCKATGYLAEQIMLARQEGVAISTLYEIAEQYEGMQAIVDIAYTSPLYASEYKQKQIAGDFRDTYVRACMSKE